MEFEASRRTEEAFARTLAVGSGSCSARLHRLHRRQGAILWGSERMVGRVEPGRGVPGETESMGNSCGQSRHQYRAGHVGEAGLATPGPASDMAGRGPSRRRL